MYCQCFCIVQIGITLRVIPEITIMFISDCASNCISCTEPGKCDQCKTGYRLKAEDKKCEGNLIDDANECSIYVGLNRV